MVSDGPTSVPLVGPRARGARHWAGGRLAPRAARDGRRPYPSSETLSNRTIGLEAVSPLAVAPWSVVAGWLGSGDHREGPVLAISPAGDAAYTFVQYSVGSRYLEYPPAIPFHPGILVLGGFVLPRAWTAIRREALPRMSARRTRISGVALLPFAISASSQCLSAVQGIPTGAPLSDESIADPSMYWSTSRLDLGVVVSITIATSEGRYRGAVRSRKALFGTLGW